MNKCILMGKVFEDVDFRFIYNDNKSISMANCKIVLTNKAQIEIYGLNEKADYMYSKLNKNDIIFICGSLVSEANIVKVKIEEIKIVK